MAKSFGESLRKLRTEARMTQEALARATGLSVSTVSKLEQGGIDPAWSTVQKLAAALNVSCESFDAGPQKPARGKGKVKSL